MEQQKTIRCIVAGHNSGGEPDLFFVKVRCSESEYGNGDHYKAAKKYAEDDGIDAGLVFDEKDPAGRAMLSLFAWDTAPLIDIDGNVLPPEEAPTEEPTPATATYDSLKDSFGGTWGELPDYPVADWQAEVADDNTRQGYWEWVESKLEDADANDDE